MIDVVGWFSENFFWIQFISASISAVLFVAIIYLIVKMDYFSDKREYGWDVIKSASVYKKRTIKIWKKILTDISSNNPDLWKKAVLQADLLLNETLRSAGYKGRDIKAKIDGIDPAQIPNISEVRTVRKNIFDLMGEDGSGLVSLEQAKEFLRVYRQTLRSFGILE